MVEGAFARAFKSGLRPVELGRRLVREMDDNRSVGVRGGTVVPEHFTVALSASDLEQFEDVQDSLGPGARRRRPRARPGRGLRVHGPGRGRARGRRAAPHRAPSRSSGGMVEGDGRRPGPARSCCPSGERFTLAETVITIGRHPDSQHRAGRPQREPQPRRDPAPGRRLRGGRPRLDQRHPGQRGTGRHSRCSRTATRSSSATPACASRRPDPQDRPPCPSSSSTSSSSACCCCSTSSSSASCGRCGPR